MKKAVLVHPTTMTWVKASVQPPPPGVRTISGCSTMGDFHAWANSPFRGDHQTSIAAIGRDEMTIYGYARVSTDGQTLDAQMPP
jgi:hypothetical protein